MRHFFILIAFQTKVKRLIGRRKLADLAKSLLKYELPNISVSRWKLNEQEGSATCFRHVLHTRTIDAQYTYLYVKMSVDIVLIASVTVGCCRHPLSKICSRMSFLCKFMVSSKVNSLFATYFVHVFCTCKWFSPHCCNQRCLLAGCNYSIETASY